MAHRRVEVSYKPVDEARIPDSLVQAAAVLMDFQERGIVEEVGERLLIRRQGGYCGVDTWLVLLVYFTTGTHQGIQKFWEENHACVRQLAAVAGRISLASPSSLSRALGSVEFELLRKTSSWLLTGTTGIDSVLGHPVVQTLDACGQGWHVFDLDPTVTTVRRRALPVDDDLPVPRRRSEATGAPGHSGRKRGDIQHRRVTVQHSGSGAWIHAHLSPGNGEGVVDFERALDTIVETCERLEHPLSRALVRMDGEYGNVPWFDACRQRGLPFITRLNRPKLYEDPQVVRRLRSATWYRVPDSRCGPRRSAADLGVVTVHPGERTRRPDGDRYEPVAVRVVASVFPKTGEAKRGRVIDGMQVELFAVDVPADAWPAPEAVAAYFGRGGEENRFAQEDRELGLDRIVSYHPPGQELGALVGLSLWNLQLVRGFEMERPPARRAVQPLRCAPVDDSIPASWPVDPVIAALLDEIDWTALLATWPQWQINPATGELQCPEKRPLTLTSVRPAEHAEGRTRLIFRRPTGGCDDCSSKPGCLRTKRTRSPKHAEFSVATSVAAPLRGRLIRVRSPATGSSPVQPIDSKPGRLAVLDSLFLPARARQAFRAAFVRATVRIEVELPESTRQPHLVAVDVADRQRRRKTWAQNVERYALPEGARVRVEVAGSALLKTMFKQRARHEVAARPAG